MYPYPFIHAPEPLSEDVFPNGDDSVSVWQNQSGGTTNLYQSVDDFGGETDYIKLKNANWILDVCSTEATRTVRFLMASPSGPVSVMQNVFVGCQSKIVDPYATGFTASVEVRFLEGSTVIASQSGDTVTSSFAEQGFGLSPDEIGAVTDWDNVKIELIWTVCASGVDADLDIHCYSVYLDFT